MFNGDNSELLFFKGRSSVLMPSEVKVNGQIVGVSEKTVHLGRTVTTTDRVYINYYGSKEIFLEKFIANFGQLYCCIKTMLFSQICCSFYGSLLWHLNGTAVQSLCVDWRKSLRSL